MRAFQLKLALLALLLPGAASGQGVTSLLEADSLDWSRWETASPEAKRGLLERLGICVDQLGMVENHHLMDFSGDGVDDLIYSGADVACDYPSASGKRTAFFLARYGKYSEIFIHNGELVGMWRAAPWQPVSFLTRAEECCGGAFVHYNYFYPVYRRSSLGYEGYSHIVGVVGMPTPGVRFEAPRPFVVQQGPYSLRVTPGIDDGFRWPYSRLFDPTGNLLAKYRRGSTGIALGEAEGPDGSTWWFVLMDASSRPLGIRGFQGEWGSSPVRRSYLGWMDSAGLEEVSWPARSLDSDRYWRRR